MFYAPTLKARAEYHKVTCHNLGRMVTPFSLGKQPRRYNHTRLAWYWLRGCSSCDHSLTHSPVGHHEEASRLPSGTERSSLPLSREQQITRHVVSNKEDACIQSTTLIDIRGTESCTCITRPDRFHVWQPYGRILVRIRLRRLSSTDAV